MFEPSIQRYGEKQILRLDFTGLTPRELADAVELASKRVRGEPPHSVRVLSILTTGLGTESLEAFRRCALQHVSHILASAFVASSFWKVIITDLQTHGREDIQIFEDERDAIAWLTSQ